LRKNSKNRGIIEVEVKVEVEVKDKVEDSTLFLYALICLICLK
jgi:hypothetical protein